MITQIFGDLLYYPQTDRMVEFPSPESLKGRIMISTKPPKEFHASRTIKDKNDESEFPDEGSSSPDLTAESEADDKVCRKMNSFFCFFLFFWVLQSSAYL